MSVDTAEPETLSDRIRNFGDTGFVDPDDYETLMDSGFDGDIAEADSLEDLEALQERDYRHEEEPAQPPVVVVAEHGAPVLPPEPVPAEAPAPVGWLENDGETSVITPTPVAVDVIKSDPASGRIHWGAWGGQGFSG